MKKITQEKLYNRLAKYGALSLAISGLTDVNGQIIYTDVDPDAGGTQLIDLNGDAAADFVITLNSSSSAVRGFPVGGGSGAANSFQNAFLGITASSFNYPTLLSTGQAISSAGPWVSAYAYNDFCYASGYPNSQFCGVTDGYVGLRFRFTSGGPFYYGWARLDVTTALGASTFVLKDFAYNSTPGAPIDAGQTTLSIEDNQLSKIKIVSLNKSIALYNLPTDSNYKLYSMTGQVVMNGDMTGSSNVIEAANLNNGVYLLEINDVNTKAVIRKKIVL